MEILLQGISQAFLLILRFDKEIINVISLTLIVSISSTFLSLLIGVFLGTVLSLSDFYGRRIVISLINTGMGLPPVVVGLFVMIMLWRNSILGFLNLLYTPYAIILAEVIIAVPIVSGLTIAALQQLNPMLKSQLISLGATKFQMTTILIKEARLPILAAIMAGFGGIISEVGAVMMVGGNIKGQTRVLTTAIVLESRMGYFDMAIALGVILLLLSFTVNLCLTFIQQKGKIK